MIKITFELNDKLIKTYTDALEAQMDLKIDSPDYDIVVDFTKNDNKDEMAKVYKSLAGPFILNYLIENEFIPKG